MLVKLVVNSRDIKDWNIFSYYLRKKGVSEEDIAKLQNGETDTIFLTMSGEEKDKVGVINAICYDLINSKLIVKNQFIVSLAENPEKNKDNIILPEEDDKVIIFGDAVIMKKVTYDKLLKANAKYNDLLATINTFLKEMDNFTKERLKLVNALKN